MAETQEPMNILLDRALQHYREKAWKQAEDACREALAREPNLFEPIFWLGRIYENQGETKKAVATYDQAIKAHPGYGGPFSRRAMALIRETWGAPPPQAAPTGAAKKITNTRIGLDGRWGNQLLQYAFLRMYAHEFGLAIEVPDWIGRDVYDFNDPPPTGGYGVLEESQLDLAGSLNRRIPQVAINADIRGYFNYHTSNFAKFRPLFQSIFVPGRNAAPVAEKAWKKLAAKGNTVVAIHLRRGDFGWGQFWIAATEWYRGWLKEIWPTLDKPVLYVATDDPNVMTELKEFKPLSQKALGKPIPGIEFFHDFHVLTQAHAVATSNSTFSIVASMLNVRARTFMRPDRTAQKLVPFDPWNTDVLQP